MLVDDNRRLRAELERRDKALALHYSEREGGADWCHEYSYAWPCQTVRLVTEASKCD